MSLTTIALIAERIDPDSELFTASEVAHFCRLSKETVHLAERSGDLRGVRFGRAVRFRRRDVLDWIEKKSGETGR